jgi:hypothetical protein
VWFDLIVYAQGARAVVVFALAFGILQFFASLRLHCTSDDEVGGVVWACACYRRPRMNTS